MSEHNLAGLCTTADSELFTSGTPRRAPRDVRHEWQVT